MTYSVNEIEGLAQKAARGIGVHPAQAMHFGRAVAHHLAAGRDPSLLEDALHNRQLLQIAPINPPESPLGDSYRAASDPDITMPKRIPCPQPLHDMLSKLAHKIYVPASDSSRAGAGAGLTDND